jgi:hypothetical protein
LILAVVVLELTCSVALEDNIVSEITTKNNSKKIATTTIIDKEVINI